jgi:hypothetical protein
MAVAHGDWKRGEQPKAARIGQLPIHAAMIAKPDRLTVSSA